MFIPVGLLLIAAVTIWLVSTVIIEAVDQLGRHSGWSKITQALLVVGVVTSLPELAITINSVALQAPQIALGTLVGSQFFLLFLVVPVLAIASRGVKLQLKAQHISLALVLLVCMIPMLSLLDQGIEWSEVALLIGFYVVCVATFWRQPSWWQRVITQFPASPADTTWLAVVKIGAGMAILMLATNTAVRQLIELAAEWQLPRFLVSLLILPICTNLPELSLALKVSKTGQRELALSDFVGSVTSNALLIGVLVLLQGGQVIIGQNINGVIWVFAIAMLVWWTTTHTRQFLSTKEGLLLLAGYAALVVTVVGVILQTAGYLK